MDVTSVLMLCRFVRDAAALTLWGSSVYSAALAPPRLRPDLDARCSKSRRAAVSALAVAVLALLPVEAASLAEAWSGAADWGTIWALLFETTIGTAWLAQAGLMAALVLASVLHPRWRDRETAAITALLLASFTLTGHAAMHEGLLGRAHQATTILHLLAAGFWLGALVPLLPTLALLREPTCRDAALTALRRFSTVGHAAVALVFATGALNAALILGHWPIDWRAPYARLLAGKVVVASLMAALAVTNRYLLVPRLGRAPLSTTRRVRQVTGIEIALGLVAIAFVAVFGQLEPA